MSTVSKLTTIKPRESSTPLYFPLCLAMRRRLFFHFSENRAASMNYYRDHESAFQPTSLRSRNTRVLWTELVKTSSSLQENGAQSFDVFPKLHFEKPHFFHVSSIRFLMYVSLKVYCSRLVSSENYATRHAHLTMMKINSK